MINAYFKNIRAEIINEILDAKSSIKIAVAWFTNIDLFNAILLKCRSNVPVHLIIINDGINFKELGLDFNLFIKEGGVLYLGDSDILMHHKFCIIDNRTLINGSYNWTYWAENKNDENITIIKNDSRIASEFDSEFNRIIATKKPTEYIDYSIIGDIGQANYFDMNSLKVDEYINSAIDLGNKGNIEMSARIFEKVNDINPVKINTIINTDVRNKDLIKQIYQSISIKNSSQFSELTYEGYCNKIRQYMLQSNYIKAIDSANLCANKFPGKFSVHAYCGDAKVKLGDIEGAETEYNKALNYYHSKGSKIIYYSKTYSYSFFPRADIYLKLGNNKKVIEVLTEALFFYTQQKIPKGIESAKGYLVKLENQEIVSRIS